jgi:hypothetical protein
MRPVRVLLATGIAILACAAVLSALLAFRLARGPIRVDFLTPRIEAAVQPRDGSYRAEIGITEVRWGGWREGLDLSLKDLRLVWRDGHTATFAGVLIALQGIALLRGTIEITAITVIEPQLRFVWHGDGNVAVELGQPGGPATGSAGLPEALVGWLVAEDPRAQLPSVRRVRVVRGELVLDDQQHGLVMRASDLHAELARAAGEARGTLHALVQLGDQSVTLRGDGVVHRAPRTAAVRLSVDGLDPPGVADALGRGTVSPLPPQFRAALAAARFPLNVIVHAAFDASVHVTALGLELNGGPGTVRLPTQPQSESPINGVQLLARWDASGAAAMDATMVGQRGHALNLDAQAHGLTAGTSAPAVQLRFGGINLHHLLGGLRSPEGTSTAAQRGPLRWLAGLDSELAGDVDVAFENGLHPATARCHLTGSAGSLTLTNLGTSAIPIERLDATLRIDAAVDQLTLEALSVDTGGPSLSVSGRLAGLRAPTGVAADAVLTALPVDSIGPMWPEEVAVGVRSWLTTNLTGGRITRLTTHIDGTLSPAATPDTIAGGARAGGMQFGLRALNGTVDFADLSIRYLATMPAVTAANGSATFDATRWDFNVPSAALAGLRVDSRVTLSGVGTSVPRIAIAGNIAGPLDALVAVLDNPPVQLGERTGEHLHGARGDVEGRVDLDFPLAGPINFDSLRLAASAQAKRVAVSSLWRDLGINDGSFAVTLKGPQFRLSGRTRLEDGQAAIDVTDTFPAAGSAQRQVHIQAELGPDDQEALGLNITPWLHGPVAVKVDFSGQGGVNGTLKAKADLRNARVSVPALRLSKEPGQPGTARARAILRAGKLDRVDPYSLDFPGFHLRGRAQRGEERWRRIDASGTISDLQSPAAAPADFNVSLDGSGASEQLELQSENVAALLQAVGLNAEGHGGQLTVSGRVDTVAGSHDFDLHGEILNFTWTKAPLLTKLLSLASFGGILKSFSNKGIEFTKMMGRVSGDVRRIVLSDASAVGPDLGLAFGGVIDREAGRIDLAGTMVPVYYGLSAALGDMPVVRNILPGRSDLGVLGIKFTVRGSLAAPDVAVDKLATVTPDIVQRLLGLTSKALTR